MNGVLCHRCALEGGMALASAATRPGRSICMPVLHHITSHHKSPFLSSILLFSSCTESTTVKELPIADKRIENQDFQSIIDSADVEGSILVYNPQDSTFHSNDFIWADKPHLPASTFKIANSIVALENGIVQSDSSMLLWDSTDRGWNKWSQDLTFKQALQYSCVPCYQELARKAGVDKMKSTLNKI